MAHLEILLIGFIIFWQIVFFIRTRRKISTFKKIIPNNLQIKESKITSASQQQSSANETLESINKYISNNQSGTLDFNLLKDIVERNINNRENNILFMIPIPLYLGLIGTILGIILGLSNIPDISSQESAGELLNYGINNLLSAVRFAMIASGFGLFCVLINSNFTFRRIKTEVETSKNNLYTFIQTEFLPKRTQGITDTLVTLEISLSKFNEDFNTNIGKFNIAMKESSESIKNQRELLKALTEESQLTNIINYNLHGAKEIEKTIELFKTFKADMGNISEFSQTTKDLFQQIRNLFTEYTKESTEREKRLEEISGMISISLSNLTKNNTAIIEEVVKTLQKAINDVVAKIHRETEENLKSVNNYTRRYIQDSENIIADGERSIKTLQDQIKTALGNTKNGVESVVTIMKEELQEILDQVKTELINKEGLKSVKESLGYLNKLHLIDNLERQAIESNEQQKQIIDVISRFTEQQRSVTPQQSEQQKQITDIISSFTKQQKSVTQALENVSKHYEKQAQSKTYFARLWERFLSLFRKKTTPKEEPKETVQDTSIREENTHRNGHPMENYTKSDHRI